MTDMSAAQPDPNPPQTCSNCRYFAHTDKAISWGRCQIAPAIYLGGNNVGSPNEPSCWSQPIMPLDGWCGDWK